MTDDLARRMDNLERKFEWLDEHGTRAVGALQLQVSELIKDSGKLENMVDALSKKLDKRSGTVWNNLMVVLALLPLYALVIALLVQH